MEQPINAHRSGIIKGLSVRPIDGRQRRGFCEIVDA